MKQTTFCAILLLATGCTSPKKAHTADPLRVGTIVVTPSSDIDAALYVGTIEEVYEPFLIKEGFLKRTPRGREATELAYRHLGFTPPGNPETLLF